MHKPIYLDYNATTPLDPRVLTAMQPFFETQFGNPASQLHSKGWEAKSAVDSAREKVAQLLHAMPHEIAFTSGATESNNWALKGLVDFLKSENPKRPLHILSSNVEHASVKETLLDLQKKGLAEVDFLPVDHQGFLSLDQIDKAKKPHTRILSLIWVHNEIGSIQNISTIAEWAQKNEIYFHSDATQAVGKIDVDVRKIPVSLLSFSGHKIYGPKGVGALFIRSLNPKVILRPLLHGGGQEPAGRSGTLNVPGIVGLGEACRIAQEEMQQDWEKVRVLSQKLWTRLHHEFPALILNGPSLGPLRSAYNLNITLPGIQGFQILPSLQRLCVSGGSACSSGNLAANPVLLALGHNPDDASVSLRLSLGRMSTPQELDEAFEIIRQGARLLL